ncbi:tetraacyldisaccharide 4'-kinase [Flavobacterium sp. '19STA2R22 D10 B1']|uniref:tetraacyldisaccharide 4'-kinase n=1 Tax=Flavobacterium aerium TaxID=3037261 RepID=UPI00278BE3CA|nr:tetraacyldisaccharide 4'-kinase [Flavobacterium sp. '19STA2R22 D10 B1']
MILLRKILFPFAVLYGAITQFRNFLFDKGWLKSYRFELPVIAVGNLSVGGTGKTPQIEYLIRLLSNQYRVATLSRGYKRKSEGYILADQNADASILGDEPFQFFQKYKDIQVAVDADRRNGIEQLLSQTVKPEVILLDDAYQHRKVQAGFYILLTAYGDLYADDYMLPTGNLRERRKGAERANIVIVTKCPAGMSAVEQQKIRIKLKLLPEQELYFTYIEYDAFVYAGQQKIAVSEIRNQEKILVAGIAKPMPFFAHLDSGQDQRMTYPDHHNFTNNEIQELAEKSKGKIIITTEKDYVRLKGKLAEEQLFYLPIKSSFIAEGDQFDQSILTYVEKGIS